MVFFKSEKSQSSFLKKAKTSNINVLFVVESLIDDCKSRSIVDFANYCLKNGACVVILTRENKIRNFTKSGIFLEIKKNFFFNSSFLTWKICSLCKKFKIDLICNCCNGFYFSIKLASKLSDAKNSVFVYNILDISSRAKYSLSKGVVEYDAIFSFTHNVCDFLLNNYEFDDNKLYNFNVSANKLEALDDFIGTGRICDMLKEIGDTSIDKKILVCFCNYSDTEVCCDILKALKFLKKRDDFFFLFVGDFNNTSKERLDLVKKIKEFGLSTFVRLSNTISDRRALLQLSYAVICLQDDDKNFLNFYCEAGFMKKPFITTTSVNSRKAIVNGKNGFLIRKSTIMDIYSSILEILEMPEDRYNKICKYAYDYANEYFDNSVAHRKILEEFLRLCSGNNEKQKKNVLKKNNSFFKRK